MTYLKDGSFGKDLTLQAMAFYTFLLPIEIHRFFRYFYRFTYSHCEPALPLSIILEILLSLVSLKMLVLYFVLKTLLSSLSRYIVA